MTKNDGSIIILAVLIWSFVMIVANFFLYSVYLDSLIVSTSLKSTQSSYRAEDKIYICFNEDKYYREELIPMLKYYIKYGHEGNIGDKGKIFLKDISFSSGDTNYVKVTNIHRENGILKGEIVSTGIYDSIEKTATGMFNIINFKYINNGSIISKNNVEDEEFFKDIFDDFKLYDFENKIQCIESSNFDKVNICILGEGKIRIDYYRYEKDIPVHQDFLDKNEVFIIVNKPDGDKCQISIINENKFDNGDLNGIIYVKGDLNIFDAIAFNGIILIDDGELEVFSEDKPEINGLVILNNYRGNEKSIENQTSLEYKLGIVEKYGVYLSNFVEPEIYAIKENSIMQWKVIEMKLYNIMEDEVKYAIDKILKTRKDICDCEKCRLDIAAIALNHLPPKYVVTEKGELYERANNLNLQFEADVVKEVAKAIEKVNRKPQHF